MSRSFVAVFAPLVLATSLAHANPDQICVPEPSNAAPMWWNVNLGPNQKESRWSNAAVRTLVSGDAHGRLRTVWSPDAQTVYVEMRVEGDPSLDPEEDQVLVALGNKTGTLPELFIRFAPVAGCEDPADCAGAGAALPAGAVLFSQVESSWISLNWGPLSETQPAGNYAIAHPWIVVEEVGDSFTWTLSFALTVPVTAAGEIRKNLRIYGNAVMYDPGPISGTYRELPLLCTSSSPISNDCLVAFSLGTDLPGDLPWPNMDDTWSVLRSLCNLIVL